MDFWESINGADSKFRFALTLDGYFEYFFRFVIVSIHDEYNYSCVLGLGESVRRDPHRDFMVVKGGDPRIKECCISRDSVDSIYASFLQRMCNPTYFHQPQLYTYFGDRERFREYGHHLRVQEYPRYYNPRIFHYSARRYSIPVILDGLNTNLWDSNRVETSFFSSAGKVDDPILHYEFWELIRLLVIEFRDCRGNWDAYLSSNTVEYVKGWLIGSLKFEKNVLDVLSVLADTHIRRKWDLHRFDFPSSVNKFPLPYMYEERIFWSLPFTGLSFNRIQNPYYFMDGDRFYRSVIETTFYNSEEGACLIRNPPEKKEVWRWDNDGNRIFRFLRKAVEWRRSCIQGYEEISVIKDWDKENFFYILDISQSLRKFNSKMYVRSVSDYHSFFELRRMVLDSLNRSTFHSSWRTTFRDSYGIVKDIFGFWNGEEYRHNLGSDRRQSDYLITDGSSYSYTRGSDSVFGLGFIFPDSAIDSFRKDWIIWINSHSSPYLKFRSFPRYLKNRNFFVKYEEFRSTRDND